MKSVPERRKSSMSVRKKVCAVGVVEGRFSREGCLEEEAFQLPFKEQREKDCPSFRKNRNRGMCQGKGDAPLKKDTDGYSDQEDSEMLFPEESCSRELIWIS